MPYPLTKASIYTCIDVMNSMVAHDIWCWNDRTILELYLELKGYSQCRYGGLRMQQVPRATREKIWFVFICPASNVGWPNIGTVALTFAQCLSKLHCYLRFCHSLDHHGMFNYNGILDVVLWVERQKIEFNLPLYMSPKTRRCQSILVNILKTLLVVLDTTAKPYMAFRFALNIFSVCRISTYFHAYTYPTHDAIRSKLEITLLPVHGDMFTCLLHTNNINTLVPGPEENRSCTESTCCCVKRVIPFCWNGTISLAFSVTNGIGQGCTLANFVQCVIWCIAANISRSWNEIRGVTWLCWWFDIAVSFFAEVSKSHWYM